MPPKKYLNLIEISANGTAILRKEIRLSESLLHRLDILLTSAPHDPAGPEKLAALDLLVAVGESLSPDQLAVFGGIERPSASRCLKDLEAWLRMDPAIPLPKEGIDIAAFLFLKRPAEITAIRRRILRLADQFEDGPGLESIRDFNKVKPEIFRMAVRAADALGDMDALLRNALRIALQANDPTVPCSPLSDFVDPVSPTNHGAIIGFLAGPPGNETRRDIQYGQLACALADSGRMHEAHQWMEMVREPVALAWSLAAFADVLSRHGRTHDAVLAAEAALEAGMEINPRENRRKAIIRLMKPLLLGGRHDLVDKGLAAIRDASENLAETDRIEALLENEAVVKQIVRICIEEGMFEKAVEYMQASGDPRNRIARLVDGMIQLRRSEVSFPDKSSLLAAGQNQIIASAKEVSGSAGIYLLMNAALDLRLEGQNGLSRALQQEAIHRMEEVESPPTRLDLEYRLCPILVVTGFADEADARLEKLLRLPLDDDTRLRILANSTLAFRAGGMPDRADHQLRESRKVLEAKRGGVWSAEALADLGIAEILLGHVQAGKDTIRGRLDSAAMKSTRRMVNWDLRVIGEALGCLGQPEIVNDLVGTIPDNQARDFLREAAVHQCLGRGWTDCRYWLLTTSDQVLGSGFDPALSALAIARGIGSDSLRSEMLGLICDSLLHAERHDAAADVVREMVPGKSRTKHTARIFQSMGFHDLSGKDLDHCKTRIPNIGSEWNRLSYGCGMAASLSVSNATLPVLGAMIPLVAGHPGLVRSALESWLLRAIFIEGHASSSLLAMIRSLALDWVENHIGTLGES